jgi:phosphatidylserine/phosphatidylglycerophosphate/cardiolipin synthase-like enzyme
MVVKKGKTTIAYCGGLDISPERTPQGWSSSFVWHDVHAQLEGRIARDIEREFILRWNREKDASTASSLPGWRGFETLDQVPIDATDQLAEKNIHKLQMLRTVSVGMLPADIRRDDIWQAYFRLIACATRFLYLENQYFHEPAMADAIIKQAESQPALIVIMVVAFEIDDPNNALTENGRAQQHEFFTRLFAHLKSDRLRVYTMKGRLVHSKLILADDRALSMGSANADPRDFFMDTQLNVMLDDAKAVGSFRRKLWAHDLGLDEKAIERWAVKDFISGWDAVAKANESLTSSPGKMQGEGVLSFDPTTVKGNPFALPGPMQSVFSVLSEVHERALQER